MHGSAKDDFSAPSDTSYNLGVDTCYSDAVPRAGCKDQRRASVAFPFESTSGLHLLEVNALLVEALCLGYLQQALARR